MIVPEPVIEAVIETETETVVEMEEPKPMPQRPIRRRVNMSRAPTNPFGGQGPMGMQGMPGMNSNNGGYGGEFENLRNDLQWRPEGHNLPSPYG